MTEWIEYTGSDEQIAEMRQSEHGFLAKNSTSESSVMSIRHNQLFIASQTDPYLPELFGNKVSVFLNYNNTTNYLICNPHPLADMICQQARTGQPVWVRVPYDEGLKPWKQIGHYQNNYQGFRVYETTTPDWNIPNAEYSFTAFEEEV